MTETDVTTRDKETVSRDWDALCSHDWDGIAAFFTEVR